MKKFILNCFGFIFIAFIIIIIEKIFYISILHILILIFIVNYISKNKKNLKFNLKFKLKFQKIKLYWIKNHKSKLLYLNKINLNKSAKIKIAKELIIINNSSYEYLCAIMSILENAHYINKTIYNDYFIKIIQKLSKNSLIEALEFGEKFHISKVHGVLNNTSLRIFISYLLKSGKIIESQKKINLFKEKNEWYYKYSKIISNEIEILNHGIKYGSKIKRDWIPSDRLHIYHTSHSLPYVNSGYSIRTHWLLSNINYYGWEFDVLNRIGFPNDRYDYKDNPQKSTFKKIDNIKYIVSSNCDFRQDDILNYHKLNVKHILKQCKETKPLIIHSASNFSCGLAATDAANQLDIPSIYEVRGFWHYTKASKIPEYYQSDHFNMVHKLEIQAAKNASHVFAITKGVKNKLIEGGINKDNITLLPNGVDINKFKAQEKNQLLLEELNINSSDVIIGYIGAFVDYEGLDYLIRAIKIIVKKGLVNFKVVLVGDGSIASSLKLLSKELNLDKHIIFIGRVEHDEVEKYYSIMDIMVYSRKGFEVCELVSPLKPLEAMAMKKIIIVSSVAALAEMVKNNYNGLIHEKDNIDDLAAKLLMVVDSEDLRNKISKNAYNWVSQNRSWASLSQIVDKTYKKILNIGNN